MAPAVLCLCQSALFAQQQSQAASESQLLRSIENSPAKPGNAHANFIPRRSFWDFANPYHSPIVPPAHLESSGRAQPLVRDGALYLSLFDAIALAIENNLDVEVGRYEIAISGADLLRARGGGNLRGVDYTVAESPTGVGGPGSPLLNAAAATVTPTTPAVTDLTPLNELTPTQTNLATQASPYSNGPPIPYFDPSIAGQLGYLRRSNTSALTSGIGSGSARGQAVNTSITNIALVGGFSMGTQIEVDINNSAQALFGNSTNLNPFSAPDTSITVTQPLLRGFGRKINLRFMRIAENNQKISRLIFYQQLTSTVYGVARLYYDLVSLIESAQVKRQTLAAAQKLYEDDVQQVQQGTLARLELTRAQALVSSSELDLIQAQGLVRQQEVILKTQISRSGAADPVLSRLSIQPTDKIQIPTSDELRPIDDMVNDAVAVRPDLAQSAIQVRSGEIAAEASRNAALPQVDLLGNFQTRGASEAPFYSPGQQGTGLLTPPSDLAAGGLRTSRIYEVGIQVNLPLRNRVALADAARDQFQVRQSQLRTQRLANQVREEVENSVIALRTARSSLEASTRSRQYQEQLLEAERDKLSVGASTNFLIVQQQAYLAQAQSTEVASRSTWIKARIALDRALGNLLEKNGIRFDDAVQGALPGH